MFLPKSNTLLTIQEAATKLGVSAKTLRRWEKKGILTAQRTIGNQRRYNLQDLENFQFNGGSNQSAINVQTDTCPSLPEATLPVQESNISGDHISNPINVLRAINVGVKKASTLAVIILSIGLILGSGLVITNNVILEGAQRPIGSQWDSIASLRSLQNDMGKLALKVLPGFVTSHFSQVNLASTYNPQVLAGETQQLILNVNVPAQFNDHTTMTTATIDTANITTATMNTAVVTGTLTAPNIIYSVKAGSGISVSAGQNPIIANTGVLSVGGQTGSLSLTAGAGITVDGLKISNSGITSLTAGTGISVSGSTITNTAPGSAQLIFKTMSALGQSDIVASSNTDTLNFASGAGMLITTDAITKTLTFTANSGFTRDSTNGYVVLTNIGDSLGIGVTNPTSKLQIAGDITPDATGTRNLGSSSLYWNNLYVNNVIGPSSGIQGYWQRNLGAISPVTLEDDILVGSIATGTAKLRISGTTGDIVTQGTINGVTMSSGVIGSAGAGATWNGVTIGTQYGGTGQNFSTAPLGSFPYFSATGVMSTLAAGVGNQILVTQDGIAAPSWQNISSLLTAGTDITMGGTTIVTINDASTLQSVTGRGASTTNPVTLNLTGGNIYLGSGNASSILDLTSTSKGFLAPRMSIAQRDAIGTPATGLLIYNTDTNQFNVYTGAVWTTISGGSGSSSSWVDTGEVLYPLNITRDLLLGGTATQSAKISFLNMGNGTPTASIAGNLVMSSPTSQINTVNMGSLNLGFSDTGRVSFMNSSNYIDANNNLYIGGNLIATGPISGFWQQTLGSLAPYNITDALNLGAIATSSALVHLTGTAGDNSFINTGYLGIGTTNPDYTLDVAGTLRTTTFLTPYEHTITVAKAGGDYTTITAALNAITDNDSTHTYLIKVMPGTYNESITMKDYVNISGAGEDTTIISGDTATVVSAASNAMIEKVKVTVSTSGNVYGIYNNGGDNFIARNIKIDVTSSDNYSAGVYATNTSQNNSFTNLNISSTSNAGGATIWAVGVRLYGASTAYLYDSQIQTTRVGGTNTSRAISLDTNDASTSLYTYNVKAISSASSGAVAIGAYANTGSTLEIYSSQFLPTSSNEFARGIVIYDSNTTLVLDHSRVIVSAASSSIDGQGIMDYRSSDTGSVTIRDSYVYINNTNQQATAFANYNGTSAKLYNSEFVAVSGGAGHAAIGADLYGTPYVQGNKFTATGLTSAVAYGVYVDTGSTSTLVNNQMAATGTTPKDLGIASGATANSSFNTYSTLVKSGTLNNVSSNGSGYLIASGRLGIGTTSPTTSLDVVGKFNVDSNGNLTKINNITYSWPSSQGTANTLLVNNGSGTLSWTDPFTGGFNYWGLTSNALSPLNSTYALNIGNTASASALFHVPGTTNNNAWFNLGSGNVGIGTTNPLATLAIGSNSDVRISTSGDVTAKTFNGITLATGSGTLTLGAYNLTAGATGTVAVGTGVANSLAYWSDINTITNVSAGSTGQCLVGNTGGVPTWGDCSAASNNLWQRTSGSVAPLNITDSLNLGAIATSSALVHLAATSGDDSWITSGKLGIGTSTPATALDVYGKFNVDLNGDITKINNIAYTWPAIQGGTSTVLTNSGTGSLSWSDAFAAGINFWGLNGNALSPLNSTYALNIGSTASTSAYFHVPGTNNDNAWFNLGTGKLGIGTTEPSYTLDVNGGIQSNGNNNFSGHTSTFYGGMVIGDNSLYQPGGTLNLQYYNPTADVDFQAGKVVFKGNGNVGIGTTNPLANLSIGENSDVRITTAGDVTAKTFNGITLATGSGTLTLGAYNLTAGATGTVAVGTGQAGYVPYWSDANTLSSEQYLATSRGGLGGDITAVGAGELVYSTGTTTYDSLAAGSSGQVLVSGGAGAPAWTDPLTGGFKYLQLTSNSLSPVNSTFAFNIGNTASASAYFHVPGTNNDNAWFNLGTGNLGIGTTAPTATLQLSSASTGINLFDILSAGSSVFTVSDTAITANLPVSFNSPGDISNAYDLNFTNPINSNINSLSSLNINAGETFNSSNLTLRTYNVGNVIVDSQALVTNYAATISGQLVVGTNSPTAMSIGNFYLTNSSTFGKALAILNQTENQAILTGSASGVTKFTFDNSGNLTTSGTINGLTMASGVITSGTWNGTAIGTQYGGTGQNWSASVQGSVPYFSGTGTMANLGPGTASQVLTTGGNGANPAWTNIASLVSGVGNIQTSGTQTITVNTIASPTFTGLTVNQYATVSASLAVGYATAPYGPGNAIFSGNVGIGITNPSYPLSITADGRAINVLSSSTDASTNMRFLNAGSNGDLNIGIENSSGGSILGGTSPFASFIGTSLSRPLEFATDNNVRMTISATGNIGIGTTDPATALDIYGKFNVDSNGNITKLNNVAYSFPSGQGAANSVLTNNGSGTLTWFDPNGGSGALGFFQRTSGSLAPYNITDSLNLGAIATSSALVHLAGTSGENSFINTGYLGIGTTAPTALLQLSSSSTGINLFDVVSGGSSAFTVSDTQIVNNLPTSFTAPGDVSMAYDLLFTNSTISNINSNAPLTIASGKNYNSDDLTLRTYNVGNVVVDSQALITNYAATISGQLVIGTSTPTALSTGNFYLTNSATFGKALAILNQTEGQDIFTASASGVSKFVITSAGKVGVGITNPSYTMDIKDSGTGFRWQGTNNYFVVRDWASSPSYGPEIVTDNNRIIMPTSVYLKDSSSMIQASGNALNFYGDNGAKITYFDGVTTQTGFILKNTGNVGIGTTAPDSKLMVQGKTTGKALAIFDETGDQAIFTASAAGSPKFIIDHSGQVGIGITNPATALDVYGKFNVDSNGNITKLNNVAYSFPGSQGAANTVLTNNGSGTLSWSDPFTAGLNFWQLTSNSLSPANSSFALNVGNSASASAFFHVPGTNNDNAWFNLGTGNLGIGTTTPTALLQLSSASTGINLFDIVSGGSSAFTVSDTGITANLPTNFTSAGDVGIAYDLNFTNAIGSNILSAAPLTIASGENFNSSDLTLRTYNAGYTIIDSQALVTNYAATVSGQLVVGTSTPTAMSIGNFYLTNSSTFGKALAILNQTESQPIFVASASGVAKFLIDSSGNVGIGTTNPGAALDIVSGVSGNNPIMKLTRTSAGSSAIEFAFDNVMSGSAYDAIIKPNLSAASGGIAFYSSLSGTESFAMGVDRYGNVGIGTASPISKLHVSGAVTGKALAIFDETGDQALFTASAAGSPKFIIDHSGQVGIGITNPGALLQVASALNTDQPLSVKVGSTVDLTFGGSDSGDYSRIIGGRTAMNFSNSNTPGRVSFTNNDPGNNAVLGIASTIDSFVVDKPLVVLGNTNATDGDFRISAGKIGIGITNPATALDVYGKFNVDSNGNITKLNNVAYSFPAAQGASNSVLTNNGSGTLSWSDPFAAGLNYWGLTSNALSPLNSTYALNIGNTASASAFFHVPGTNNDNAWFNLGTGNLGIGTTTPTALLQLSSSSTGINLFDVVSGGSSAFTVSDTGITANLPTSFNAPGDLVVAYDLNLTNSTVGNIKSAAPLAITAGDSFNSSDLTLRTYNTGNVVVDSQALNVLYSATVSGQMVIGTSAPSAPNIGQFYLTNSQTYGKALAILNQTENQDIFTASASGVSKFVINSSGYVGVGTTNPAYLVNIAPPSNAQATLGLTSTSGNGSAIYLGSNGTYKSFIGQSIGIADALQFFTGGVSSISRMTILGTGQIGIGLANSVSPNSLFEVNGATVGKALVSLNETGDQAIFTASASGSPKFIIDHSGNVGIGTTAPATALDVYGKFNVDSNGNITKLNNVVTSFPSSQGSANSVLTNNGSGTLSWSDPFAAGLNYWGLTSNALSPLNSTYALNIGNTASASAYFHVPGTNNDNAWFNLGTANLGIGTTAPTATLQISSSSTGINLFDILSSGSSAFTVSDTAVTSNLPTSFTSAGDVSLSYDLNFANSTNANIKSSGPLNILTGETFNSSDFTIRTYNYGNTVLDSHLFVQNLSSTAGKALAIFDQKESQDILTASASGTTRFVITNAGNVGIGTVTPAEKLEVNGNVRLTNNGFITSTAGFLSLEAANGLYLRSNLAASSINIADNTTANVLVAVGGGNVGIGTSLPTSKLMVQGKVTGKALVSFDETGDQAIFTASAAGSPKFIIDHAGNVGIGITNPASPLEVINSSSSQGDYAIRGTATTGNGSAFLATAAGGGYYYAGAGNVSLTALNGSAYITSAAGDGRVNLYPSGTGDIVMLTNNLSTLTGNVGIGTSTTIGKLTLQGATTGKALAVFDETGDQAIFTASASGVSKFIIDHSGNVGIGTTSPAYKLDVNGIARANQFYGNGGGVVTDPMYTADMDSNTGMWFPGSDTLAFSTAATERLRINASGYVGIGATAPTATLQISSASTGINLFDILSAGSSAFTVSDTAITANLPTSFTSSGDVTMANDLNFSNATNANINSTGPLIINTGEIFNSSNLTLKTYNSGNVVVDSHLFVQNSYVSGQALAILNQTESQDIFTASSSGTTRFQIASSGTVTMNSYASGSTSFTTGGVITTSSDIRKKDILGSLGPVMDNLMQINPVYFAWKPGTPEYENGRKNIGLVAQNVQSYFPELVGENQNGELGLNYNYYTAVLTKAIQEQQGEIASQSALLAQLDQNGNMMSASQADLTSIQETLASQGLALQNHDTQLIDLASQALGLQGRVDSLEASASAQQADIDQLKSEIAILNLYTGNQASLSASLSDLSSIEAETATISGSLTVFGKANISDLGVTGTITNGMLTIDGFNGEINTLADSLKIQSNALADIEFQGAQIVMDTKGNMTVNGTLTAKTVEAQEFKVLGAQTAGSSILLAGQTIATVSADVATDSARILITPTSLTDKILTVIRKDVDSFTVAIKTASTSNVKFDWFIVK